VRKSERRIEVRRVELGGGLVALFGVEHPIEQLLGAGDDERGRLVLGEGGARLRCCGQRLGGLLQRGEGLHLAVGPDRVVRFAGDRRLPER